LGEIKRKESDSPLIDIELFMLGRLMQYAWDSKSEAKELVIKYGSSIILDVRSEMLSLLIEETGIEKLPTISSDFAILHLFDLSYSSLFLVREIEQFIAYNFDILKAKDKISEDNDKSIIYFSSIFVLTSYKIINKNFIESFFNDFLVIESKVKEKDIIIPLIKLFNFLVNKNLIEIDLEVERKLEHQYKELSKKFNHLIIKTFVAKNKDELPYYRRIYRKTKHNFRAIK
jgi:hypothetical protein